MTKDKVLERVKTLEIEREQLKVTLGAYEGALQDCKYWIEEFDKVKEDKKKDK